MQCDEVIVREDIKMKIHQIRGKQVMLDSDVAFLYHYEVKRINEVVKRNIKRFPDDFCFQLSEEEYDELFNQRGKNLLINLSQFATSHEEIEKSQSLRSQFTTLKTETGSGKHRKYIPYVFTEQGIAMLSGLLKSDVAIDISIKIMKAFAEMRKFIHDNIGMYKEIDNIKHLLLEHDDKITEIFNRFQNNCDIKQQLFYNGQVYDAHSLIVTIFSSAEKNIVIIDNYIDKTVLDIVSTLNYTGKITIVTKEKCHLSNTDISKYNEQYNNLLVRYSNDFHDRFIIIDDKALYHLGASIKDVGKKVFGINKMEDAKCLKLLLSIINKIK